MQSLGCFDFYQEESNQLHKRHVYSFETNGLPNQWEHRVSSGEEDKGLVFDFYWLAVDIARKKLVSDMGNYLLY